MLRPDPHTRLGATLFGKWSVVVVVVAAVVLSVRLAGEVLKTVVSKQLSV